MFDLDFKDLGRSSRLRDLLIRQFLIRVIFHCKPFQQGKRLLPRLKQAASAEDDRALHIRRPCFLPDRFIPINREAHLIRSPQRIDLVSCARAMEIDLLLISVVKIVDRDRIRITVIPVYRENAASALLQK